jgi:hypothetical protein
MNFIRQIIERLKESKSAKSMPIRVWKVENGETVEVEWDPVEGKFKEVKECTTDSNV